MLIYRIAFHEYANSLVASGLEGRWNGRGRKVIYAADSIALAFLENMIRRKGVGFNNDFRTMVIELPDQLKILEVKVNDLPVGWQDPLDYSGCQEIGNKWYDETSVPVLKVPSAVLPESFNFVLNTMHPDFKKIKLLKSLPLIPDSRLEKLLKTSSKEK